MNLILSRSVASQIKKKKIKLLGEELKVKKNGDKRGKKTIRKLKRIKVVKKNYIFLKNF